MICQAKKAEFLVIAYMFTFYILIMYKIPSYGMVKNMSNGNNTFSKSNYIHSDRLFQSFGNKKKKTRLVMIYTGISLFHILSYLMG